VRAAFLAVLAMASIAGTEQAGATSPECQRDLFFADGGLKSARREAEQAEGANLATQCVTWRKHLETMQRAESAYARCLTGPEKDGQVEIVREQITLARDRLRRCPRP
jgi:hypothetical protein